eukprot:15485237-Alexandrium_andersonii.AAC.1
MQGVPSDLSRASRLSEPTTAKLMSGAASASPSPAAVGGPRSMMALPLLIQPYPRARRPLEWNLMRAAQRESKQACYFGQHTRCLLARHSHG